MSDTTRAAVEAALRDHIADEEPGTHLDGWLLIASTQTIDETEVELGYSVLGAHGQPTHVSHGLAGHLSMWVSQLVRRSIGG